MRHDREHPETVEVEARPIVCATGLEPSGTAILHDLLSLHGRLRPLLRWD